MDTRGRKATYAIRYPHCPKHMPEIVWPTGGCSLCAKEIVAARAPAMHKLMLAGERVNVVDDEMWNWIHGVHSTHFASKSSRVLASLRRADNKDFWQMRTRMLMKQGII